MKVLVVGNGGREHAIIWKLKQSPLVDEIYCAAGNAGIGLDAKLVPIQPMEIEKMADFAEENKIDFTVIGMDDPLAAGIVDVFEGRGLKVFGPRKNAAVIEASKVFSKNLMKKYGIPTGAYEVFSDYDSAYKYCETSKYPLVVKADGLALGKGVLICETFEDAKDALTEIMLDKKFGDSGNNVVIEEFLTGPEVSVLSFCDGKTVKPMVSAQDHKRAMDNDKGLNTGGMGTFSPGRIYTDELAAECMETIYKPTVAAMAAEGRPFKGILYFGLMLTPDGVRVLEYNARFGDPEAQVVLPRLKTDLMEIFLAVEGERLDKIDIEWYDNAAACVILASGGYPEDYKKGYEITGLEKLAGRDDIVVFHAGTAEKDGKIVTNGGRVLGVTGIGKDMTEAIEKAYEGVKLIDFKDKHFRTDIGKKYFL
ncbi:MAG: phosphoribosylamine--glycine ligase [Firmicutes bacterium]|nr:phosphoribosylamine--glycine ligase [Bacillota bacterium]